MEELCLADRSGRGVAGITVDSGAAKFPYRHQVWPRSVDAGHRPGANTRERCRGRRVRASSRTKVGEGPDVQLEGGLAGDDDADRGAHRIVLDDEDALHKHSNTFVVRARFMMGARQQRNVDNMGINVLHESGLARQEDLRYQEEPT